VPGRPLDRDDLLELFAELSAELHAEQTSTASGGSHQEFATLSPGLPPLATLLPIGSTITPWRLRHTA
jgi:hypothetical protein